MDEDLVYEVLSVVDEIPEGKVATYGQIAKLIDRPRNARLVDYPCHRVVNHAGRLVPGWMEQRDRLEAEGVVMKDSSHVDIKASQWDIDTD